jgi:hypothetical protein
VNRKQRKRLHRQRTYDGPRNPTAATLALGRVHAKASDESITITPQYIEDNMMLAGFLPDGSGGWRAMTPVERKRWLGKEA